MMIAVLALQGAFIEHEHMLQKLGADTIELRKTDDLQKDFNGLILPGGESTVQGKLLHDLDMFEPLKEKMFEDYFTEIQSDMVSICLEYVENKADEIYIYTSFESNVATSNYFYNIGGNILKKHNLNNANNGFNYDVSLERQRDCLQILIDDIKQLVEVCKKYGRPMPTEIKMVYDVKTKQFNADYKYNLVHSNHKTKTADDIVNDWYYEVKNKRNSSL